MKIIFLDIDGPMIPATSLLFEPMAGWNQILDDRCVKVLHLIIAESNAQLVFNTTHNKMLYSTSHRIGSPGLIKQFEDAGFKENIHPTICTQYPDINRELAITAWLHEHGDKDTKWVAFDDVALKFDEAYLTDYDLGIGIGEFNHAAHYLDFRKRIML